MIGRDRSSDARIDESGEAMLAVADVIWVELVRLSAEHRREIDAMDAAAEAGNPPPGTQWLDGMPVFTQPRAKLIPLTGCSDASDERWVCCRKLSKGAAGQAAVDCRNEGRIRKGPQGSKSRSDTSQ
jgi:hypothetical protein